VYGLLRICARAVVALALVQVACLAAPVDRAPSAVALMTPAAGTELIGSLPLRVGASGAPSSAGDAAESPHVHEGEHGPDPVSAALLALDALVALAVIVLLARRPRPRRAAGRSSREPAAAEPAEEREDTGDDERGRGEHVGSDVR
jgi:hypothetical protein